MPLFPNRKCLLLFTSMGIHGRSFLAYNFFITTFCSCKRRPLQLIRRQLWELRVVCKGAGSLLLLPSSKILRVVHWHTWGIKVRGVPAPLKDLPMEMLGLTTFWKTLIFKVNRDPFHSASPPRPGQATRSCIHPHSCTELQEQALVKGQLEWKPGEGTLTFRGGHAPPSEHRAATPRVFRKYCQGLKMPTLHHLVRRLHLP